MDRNLVIFLSAAALGLASCDSASDAVSDTISDAIVDTVSVDPAMQVSSLLEKNDTSACANQAAIDTALGAANRGYSSYLENGGQRLRVDTISATSVDKDIHEISCSSMIHYQMSDEAGFSRRFDFRLRPMLGAENANFVAEVIDAQGAGAAVMWHMAWWKNGQKESGSKGIGPTAAEDIAADPAVVKAVWSPKEAKLIKEFSDLESDCRGSDNPEVAENACSARDDQDSGLRRQLRAANICFGKESDESAADNDFHRCAADSILF